MRYIVVLIFLCVTKLTYSSEFEEQRLFKGVRGSDTIRVLSSTDISVFAPTIQGFLSLNPELNVEYLVAGSADINSFFRQSPARFDIVISSAMDLQLKLVNDGYARKIESLDHPDWAQWRQSLFGFTLEPAGIVYNKKHFEGLSVPASRQEMIQLLREHPERFRGKIATYDVRSSGLGYLFATQDARDSESYWRLMEIMGSLDTRLYCCSGEMIDDLSNGKIAIAYNVLTSYAGARTDVADLIDWTLPSDFSNVMMRTVLVSENTARPRPAIEFVRYLTTLATSDKSSEGFSLPSLQGSGSDDQSSVISLEPGLMIFLDRLKRKTFINEWESAIIQ